MVFVTLHPCARGRPGKNHLSLEGRGRSSSWGLYLKPSSSSSRCTWHLERPALASTPRLLVAVELWGHPALDRPAVSGDRLMFQPASPADLACSTSRTAPVPVGAALLQHSAAAASGSGPASHHSSLNFGQHSLGKDFNAEVVLVAVFVTGVRIPSTCS